MRLDSWGKILAAKRGLVLTGLRFSSPPQKYDGVHSENMERLCSLHAAAIHSFFVMRESQE
jgi:hypothetical protein